MRSPFLDSSQTATEKEFPRPSSPVRATRLKTAAESRQQQESEADAGSLAQHHPPLRFEYLKSPKPISPNKALLDYNEDPQTPSGFYSENYFEESHDEPELHWVEKH